METARQPRLALLGLGTMGAAMAGTALRSGLPLVVWNRDPDAAAHFAAQGVDVAASVPAAVEEADVVITMVTNADAVMSIASEHGPPECAAAGGRVGADEHHRRPGD